MGGIMTLVALFVLCLFSFEGLAAGPSETSRYRALKTLKSMSLEQKINMLHGTSQTYPYVGMVAPIPTLGIPELRMEDGPSGVADGAQNVTCWPSALTVTQQWSRESQFVYGSLLASEQRSKGSVTMLGPMVNLARVPQGGRNFESMGEDPFLTSELASSEIKGIQSQKVQANVKHFINNNFETNRQNYSANIDMRTQYELYLQPFAAAVDAGVLSVMCSYNRINGVHACQNAQTIGLLKGLLGFPYYIVSDWGGTHSTLDSAHAGLDIEMPASQYFGDALLKAVQTGQVTESNIDDKVFRILLSMYEVGAFDDFPNGNITTPVTSSLHNEYARDLATNSTVLLQNNGVLPLDVSSIKSIAVIGDMASAGQNLIAGGGSGHVDASYNISAFEGISNWTKPFNVKVVYAPSDINAAVSAAKSSEYAVVVVGSYSHEGSDRTTLGLGSEQDALVSAVCGANKNTIVALHSPAASLTPFKSQCAAILNQGYPGQEDGNALARVIFGDHNPFARLSVTWPDSDTQSGLTQSQWPGINQQANYTEKLLIGYRWYHAKSLTPNFWFGHGLSYTTFDYSNFTVSSIGQFELKFSCVVKNSGSRSGKEIVQLYIQFPEEHNEPKYQLKGFESVWLEAGQSETVEITVLPDSAFKIWDEKLNQPTVAKGNFIAWFGKSSNNFEGSVTFTN